ncbi:MAG: cysQ [Chitinophagaceae bacterium]|nr:cysQ [Chitinophagaceae bacterium]
MLNSFSSVLFLGNSVFLKPMKTMKQELIEIALKAGEKIMEIYLHDDFHASIDFKADHSPLTKADKAAHIVIDEALKGLWSDIPVLSEEGKHTDYTERKEWTKFWLVDPLDGTREFIKRNGQFTVNIALMENGYPVLGLVYVPVQKVLYWGDAQGAVKIIDGIETSIHVKNTHTHITAVGSRSHSSQEEADVMAKYKVEETIAVGSSLKFCMIAEGSADLYYRHGPTMEWDTAAGQAVVEAAGGKVLLPDGKRFRYNKENLLNSSFYCLGQIPFLN